MKRLVGMGLVSLSAVLAACGSDAVPVDGGAEPVDAAAVDAAGDDAGALPTTLGPAERPAGLVIPPAHDGTTPLPIVFLLHGYGATAEIQDLYFRASTTARTQGYYLVLPNGTVDSTGKRFWNATPACCDFGGTEVDDVAYLTSLLDEAESMLPVDTSRVYFYGHSNGGFMSYRMACELSDRITAIASLAGSDFRNETDCVPDRAVSVLQVHGTDDETIAYEGTTAYPSARASAARWAERAGCDPTAMTTGAPLDLESALEGAETTVEQLRTGCMPGVDAELWTIVGGTHIPALERTWGEAVYGWLSTHQR